jgi:hypothetical protein
LKAALLAIRPKITEPQMSMLRAHYFCPRLSTERLAFFGGYGNNYAAGNLQYGILGARIADELGFVDRGIYAIASGVDGDDSRGHFQWQMDDAAAKALDQLGWFSEAAEEISKSESIESSETPEVEREAVIKARIGQGKFRVDVITLWGSCAVTGCSLAKVLNASHIVPWAECATDKEKIDPFNGLLLTPNLDKLVDRCLISFKDDGSILLSKKLGTEERRILGVSEQDRLRFVRPAMLPYLKRNRQRFDHERSGGRIVKVQAI